LVEELLSNGLEGLPELLRVVVDQAMQVEREKYLQADPYERTAERRGHANGYMPKTVNTRVGKVTTADVNLRRSPAVEGAFFILIN
jgi:putative transposase